MRALLVMPLLVPLLAIGSPASAESAVDIHLVTEAYPPFTFLEGGIYKGASVDQMKLIMKGTHMTYTMEIMPWARALALATSQSNTCVFSTVHNADRHPKFKWVEPISISRTILIRKKGTPVMPKTLEEAKDFIVGTQRDDFTQSIFEAKGFSRIDLATDLSLTMKKLLSERIDLMPISEQYYEKIEAEGAPVEKVLLLTESIYALACNRAVPDSAIKRMQTALDELIASGMQDKIYEQYGLSKK